MLDLGTKRNPKSTEGMQTDLSLVPGPWVTLTLDQLLEDSKSSSLGLMLPPSKKNDEAITSEEVVKQFSYIMSEKVKKDQQEKKAGKAKLTSLIDFTCAVTLTNSNSISTSRSQLSK